MTLPRASEPAASPTSFPTPTVVPVTSTSTAIPTSTRAPEPAEWCSESNPLADDFLIIGYLPEYRALDPEWGKCLTDLIYFSIQPLPDGSLDNSALNIQTLQMLREMHTAYGTRIHVSIGGWERSNNFAPMATEPKARKNFVGNLISFCLENELDGIDFDWEFPENEREIQAYADLLTEVKAAFRPRGWIVSVALAPSDQINLAPYAAVDRIHIMSYDRGSKHATPEQAQQDVALFLSTGVAQKRLILGMPFYGRSITPPHEEYLYAEIMARYHPSPTTDEVDNIYFNGIGTIQQKTCLAKTERLGGVMVWELGQDSHDDTSLLRAIYQAAAGECGP